MWSVSKAATPTYSDAAARRPRTWWTSPFCVVPGVSSFYAAPAYAGIPLTHRDCANAFEVITGHRRGDAADDEDVNFPDYDPFRSYVFLMGMKNIARIASALITDKHFPPETPAAVIAWGTRPEQRTSRGHPGNASG